MTPLPAGLCRLLILVNFSSQARRLWGGKKNWEQKNKFLNGWGSFLRCEHRKMITIKNLVC